jgi:hypothetical protein
MSGSALRVRLAPRPCRGLPYASGSAMPGSALRVRLVPRLYWGLPYASGRAPRLCRGLPYASGWLPGHAGVCPMRLVGLPGHAGVCPTRPAGSPAWPGSALRVRPACFPAILGSALRVRLAPRPCRGLPYASGWRASRLSPRRTSRSISINTYRVGLRPIPLMCPDRPSSKYNRTSALYNLRQLQPIGRLDDTVTLRNSNAYRPHSLSKPHPKRRHH